MGKGSSMVVIRPEKPRDYAGVHEVNRLAFRRESEARLIESLRGSPGFVPGLSLVAVGGKNVVGHILFSPVSIETPDGEFPALVMAPMAVRPEQKEDINFKLMRQGLKECQRLGHRCVVAIGALEDYTRFGFTPAHRMGLRPSFRIPVGDLMVLELTPGALDGVKGTVKFPPVFSELWEAVTL
jgi:putative acetyltransferase